MGRGGGGARGGTFTSGVKAISLEDKGLRAKNTGFGILTHAITGWNGNHLTGANVFTPPPLLSALHCIALVHRHWNLNVRLAAGLFNFQKKRKCFLHRLVDANAKLIHWLSACVNQCARSASWLFLLLLVLLAG